MEEAATGTEAGAGVGAGAGAGAGADITAGTLTIATGATAGERSVGRSH